MLENDPAEKQGDTQYAIQISSQSGKLFNMTFRQMTFFITSHLFFQNAVVGSHAIFSETFIFILLHTTHKSQHAKLVTSAKSCMWDFVTKISAHYCKFWNGTNLSLSQNQLKKKKTHQKTHLFLSLSTAWSKADLHPYLKCDVNCSSTCGMQTFGSACMDCKWW